MEVMFLNVQYVVESFKMIHTACEWNSNFEIDIILHTYSDFNT